MNSIVMGNLISSLASLTHHDEVQYEHDVLLVHGVLPQLRGVVDRVDGQSGHVGPVVLHDPLLVGYVIGFDLPELAEVVSDAEQKDGQDVAEAPAHGALREREADGDEPLRGHGQDAVHAAGQGDVDDGDCVGRQQGQHPH